VVQVHREHFDEVVIAKVIGGQNFIKFCHAQNLENEQKEMHRRSLSQPPSRDGHDKKVPRA